MRISFGGGSSGNRTLYLFMGLSVLLLIVLWQVINKVPVFFSTFQSTGSRQAIAANRFDEAQKDILKKRYAGYWVYENDTLSGTNAIHKKDLIELKNNGIVWQVIRWEVTMPDKLQRAFTQVRTAYCNPFGRGDGGDTICETAILKQAFMTDGDTCVDNSTKVVQLETWNVSRRGDTLVLCNRKYTKYAGEPSLFFPEGLIRIVDSISRRMCKGQMYVSEYVRSAVAASLEKTIASGDRKAEIISLIERYYVPAVIAENWRGFFNAGPKKIGVSFEVTPAGSIIKMKLTTSRDQGKIFFRGLQFEMESWRFPKQTGGDAGNLSMEYQFDLSLGDNR
jgi:hypothetical protein